MQSQTCTCPCGESTFVIKSKPLIRFYCHCTICQSLYKKPFVDVSALWAGNVELPENHNLHFGKYRLPPALSRGICKSCSSPVVGFLRLAPFVRLAFFPSRSVEDESSLRDSQGHIFYHRCLAESGDALPKFSGYWKSELAVTSMLIGSMLKRS